MKIEDAIRIAVTAHYGQVDKGGKPYILHPLWVMHLAPNDNDIQVVAVLHDVVEDTPVTLKYLKESGLTEVQAEALQLLTHKSGVPYSAYIKGIRDNEIATKVKIEDLRHNMFPDRVRSAVEFIRNSKTFSISQSEVQLARLEHKQQVYMRALMFLEGRLPVCGLID